MNDADCGEAGRYDCPDRRLPPLAVDDVYEHGNPAERHQNSAALETEDAPEIGSGNGKRERRAKGRC